MVRDMTQRETMARTDDIHRRSSIDTARRLIYEKNYRVNSAAVESILRDRSLVPTAVSSVYSLRWKQYLYPKITECLFRHIIFGWFQLLRDAASGSNA
jgi:hypothetical protein